MSGAGQPRDDFERELLPQLKFFRAMAQKLTRNSNTAEDLYGDTILRMIEYKDSYKIGTTIRGWGCFIMRNLLFSRNRRSWRWQEWNDHYDITLADADNPHARLELKEVLEAFKYLQPSHAEAVFMLAEGLSYEEAAREAGVEAGTIKSRVSRGRAQLEAIFRA